MVGGDVGLLEMRADGLVAGTMVASLTGYMDAGGRGHRSHSYRERALSFGARAAPQRAMPPKVQLTLGDVHTMGESGDTAASAESNITVDPTQAGIVNDNVPGATEPLQAPLHPVPPWRLPGPPAPAPRWKPSEEAARCIQRAIASTQAMQDAINAMQEAPYPSPPPPDPVAALQRCSVGEATTRRKACRWSICSCSSTSAENPRG